MQAKVSIQINAPIEAVWKELTNHRGMIDWPIINKIEILEEGKDHPNGVGCRRKVKSGPLQLEEKITRFDAPHRMDYFAYKANMPLKHEGGYIELKEKDDGTAVTWESNVLADTWNPIVKWLLLKSMKRQLPSGFKSCLQFVKAKLETPNS